MEHYSNNQYEDDLTVGADDYEDMLYPGDIDLFAFQDEEASPISQLKRLVLSLDWEITDDVLLRFDEELVDLRDAWADDKVRLVYVQALGKIGRYIYRYKADAHRDAINALLSMYQSLEKIVLSEDLSDADVTSLLKTDIAKFERLKRLIFKSISEGQSSYGKTSVVRGDTEQDVGQKLEELVTLKAIVLGIDWEITAEELLNLQNEVERLQSVFAQNPVWLIFLQGISLLGKYVRKLGSNAHRDVFGLLGSFYHGLEQVVGTSLSFDEQKKLLFQEVDKFNEFKILILEKEKKSSFSEDVEIVPALANFPEDEVLGSREEHTEALGDSEPSESIEEYVDQFFSAENNIIVVEQQSVDENISAERKEEVDAFFGTAEENTTVTIDKETALLGVNVESEDDEETETESLADASNKEALAFVDEEQSVFKEDDSEKEFAEEQLPGDIAGRIDSFFADIPGAAENDGEQKSEDGLFVVPEDVALQGVDVEFEDDRDEEEFGSQNFADVVDETPFATPVEKNDTLSVEAMAEDVAPALSGFDDSLDEQPLEAEDVASVEEVSDEDVIPTLSDLEDSLDEDRISESVEVHDSPEKNVPVGAGIFSSVPLSVSKEEEAVGNDSGATSLELVESLGNVVQVLTLDQDNSVIPELFATIESLQQLWDEMPLHRSYLELISVVVQHIDRYHYKRSSDTLSLLLVLVENVKEFCGTDVSSEKFQKSFREDMRAVLAWQQELLATYDTGDDVLPENGIVADGVVLSDTGDDDNTVPADTFIADLGDIDDVISDEIIEDTGLEEALDQELESQQFTVSEDDEINSLLRQEIISLRESLQQELAELRSALKKEK